MLTRSVFAAQAGVVGARLQNCELGVTPLSYGLFKSINCRFLVRPEWLVYELGLATSFKPFDDSAFAGQIEDRELLSAVCDRLFKGQFENEQHRATAFVWERRGLVDSMQALTDYLASDVPIPDEILRQLSESVEAFLPRARESVIRTQKANAALQKQKAPKL